MNWDDLRYVLAIARTGGFAPAARRLAVNESTVSRRLARAEDGFGAQLFERVDGTLRPTDAGTDVVREAEAIESRVHAAAERVGGSEGTVSGTVRVTAVPIVANRILVPALAELLDRYPNLQVDLVAEPRDLSLMQRQTDIALRFARPVREMRALARRVGALDFALYRRADADPESLPFLTYDDSMRDLPQSAWLRTAIVRASGAPPPVRVGDAETLLACIKAGLGQSLLPVAVGDTEPELIRTDRDRVVLSRELWLMLHPDLRNLGRIRATADWIAAVVGRVA